MLNRQIKLVCFITVLLVLGLLLIDRKVLTTARNKELVKVETARKIQEIPKPLSAEELRTQEVATGIPTGVLNGKMFLANGGSLSWDGLRISSTSDGDQKVEIDIRFSALKYKNEFGDLELIVADEKDFHPLILLDDGSGAPTRVESNYQMVIRSRGFDVNSPIIPISICLVINQNPPTSIEGTFGVISKVRN